MYAPRGSIDGDRDLVKTGVSGLDTLLGGGIPRGNIVLLEGAIGTGKSTLGVEFVYRGASLFDEPGLIVLFEADDRTAVLAVEPTAFSDQRRVALPEEAIADTVIRLRMEDVTRSTVRSIEIVKSRGHDFQMGRHSFRIVDGRGMAVYRRVQAPRSASRDQAAAFDATTRITTGVPGLDPLVNGGYFLGSTTVVAGIRASM